MVIHKFNKKGINNNLSLKGEISSPINPKAGCSFVGCCIYATDIFLHQNPNLIGVLPDHMVACHTVYEVNGITKTEI